MWTLIVALLLSSGGVRTEAAPDGVVRQLYAYVVAHHPLGIPTGADKAALEPLLSSRLIRQLEAAQKCEEDYRRQHVDEVGKPEFGWLEAGLFSGDNEEAEPSQVTVQRNESKRDGTVWVHVRFTYGETAATYGRSPNPANTFHWNGAAVVKIEDGRFVVDDIVLFKDSSTTIESRLSQMFEGCSGARWIGYRKR